MYPTKLVVWAVAAMKQLKVLVIDDQRDFAEGLAEILEMLGHAAELAHDGKEAVKRMQEADFDLTLMDLRMPGMNGVEAALEVFHDKPKTKIVMMTAFVEDVIEIGLQNGVLGVLRKPFGFRELDKYLKFVSQDAQSEAVS